MTIAIKRVYDPPCPDDGVRILVDRLWPRGLRKQQAKVDRWLKEIAPSSKLRQWFAHDEGKWKEFKRRYAQELDKRADLVGQLRRQVSAKKITLLYSAKGAQYNNAVALLEYLTRTRRKVAA